MLTAEGYLCRVVEQWVPKAPSKKPLAEGEKELTGFRRDLFGCIDILAIRKGKTLAVQTTSDTNVAARIHKIQCLMEFEWMKLAGWDIHVHGWAGNELRVVDMTTRETLFSEILKMGPRKKGRLRNQVALFS